MSLEKVEVSWPPGWKEGVARMMGQAMTYVLEVRKSLYQLYGNEPRSRLTPVQWMKAVQTGIGQSSLTAGMVYGTYYHVYHRCLTEAKMGLTEANALATFITSVIKIPLSNAIRWIQLNPEKRTNILLALRDIHRGSGVRGLYSGYGWSYIEDFIEMALRDRLFEWIDGRMNLKKQKQTSGFVGGAISGATVAYLTTPFDTLRCHLTYRAAAAAPGAKAVRQVASVFQIAQTHGVGVFYRGARTRAISTGLRMAFFYMFMKVL